MYGKISPSVWVEPGDEGSKLVQVTYVDHK